MREARVANETGLTLLMKGMPLWANGCPRRGVAIPSVRNKRPGSVESFQQRHPERAVGE